MGAMNRQLEVTLFGGFEARLASGAVPRLPTKKSQALLAYLAVRPGQPHSRDKLAALLWADKSDVQARDGLRHTILLLRRALAGLDVSALRIEGQSVALDRAEVDVDVPAFEGCVAEGTSPALERAAALYRGDFLLGFTVDEPLFEEWLVAERERLREMALAALTRLLADQTETANTERPIQTALRLLALDPLQEAVHRSLMRLYARQGRRSAALKQYQICVGALQRELGAEPEAETKQLYQELLRRSVEGPRSAEAGAARGIRRSAAVPAPPDLPTTETPLVGRQDALERLRAGLEDAERGRGHVATVVGEAGIGKTRLISALAAEALSRNCRVLIGRCHESDSILPFGPWVDACRTGAVSSDEDILATVHPARRAELTRLFPEADMAGLPAASDSALPLFESVTELIERVSARQPLVLVLEDVHWADETSLRLLAYVVRRIATWPVLLVATARHEDLAEASMARRTMQDLSAGSGVTALALSPLSRSETILLVQALTRTGETAPAAAHVEEQVWAMSEGNPFVAVEAVRALERGQETNGPPGAVTLPASVRDLIARRLDRLSTRSQQLVAVAAVIGRQFDFALLGSAGAIDEREVAESVEELVRQHVLQAVGSQLDFTHDRVRDAAYGRLLPARRRVLHRAVVEALEAADADDVEPTLAARGGQSPRPETHSDRIEQLAHHAHRGELPEKAVRYLRLAGQRALARSALADARVWFERALGLLETLPATPATRQQAFEIRVDLRPVLIYLGEGRLMLERLREAEALAEQLNDDRRRGSVQGFLAATHALLGESDQALAAGGRARETASRLGDLRLRIHATSHLLQAHHLRGDHERVVDLAADNLAALPPELVHDRLGSAVTPSVLDRSWLLISLAEMGRFAEAAEHAADAICLAEVTQHAYTIGLAHCSAGTLHLLARDWVKARERLDHGIAVLRTGNIVVGLSTTIASSAWVLAELGEVDEALHRVQEGEQLIEHLGARGFIAFFGWSHFTLGRACLALGRVDDAARHGERAVESSPCNPAWAAHAFHLLGDVAMRPDRFDAEHAERRYRRALAVAEVRRMRPLAAHCHRGLGQLYARIGERERAAEHADMAAAMYRAMGLAQADTRQRP